MVRICLRVENIEVILAKRNMEKLELAERLKISPSYLTQMLMGIRSPSPKMRGRLQRVLRIKGEQWDDIFLIQNSDPR